MIKHSDWTPTCKMPKRPAKQAKPLIALQQAISRALFGRTRMFANPNVPDVVPSSIK